MSVKGGGAEEVIGKAKIRDEEGPMWKGIEGEEGEGGGYSWTSETEHYKTG